MLHNSSRKLKIGLMIVGLSNIAMATVAPKITVAPGKILSSLRCSKDISQQMKKWKSQSDWSKHISQSGNDGVILRTPTSDFATWIGVDVVGKEATLELAKPLNSVKITFDQKCVAQTQVIMLKPDFSFDDRFTDEHLAKFMDQNPKGIVYTWSANMPWSVEGIKEIREAGKKLNVPVIVLMAPDSDSTLTKGLVEKKIINIEDTKKHASLEFVMRGVSLHDPSVIWFKNKKLARWARPGHEKAYLYVSSLSKELK